MAVQLISMNLLTLNIVVFLFSALVAFFISFFSYKAFRLTKEKKHLYFSIGFILLSLGLIMHSVGNLSIYLGIKRCLMNTLCSLSQRTLSIAYLSHILLTFLAYVTLILIYFKVKEKAIAVFAFVQAILLATLTYDSDMFNVVGFIFTLFIVYGTYRNYKSNKNINTKLALIAFSLISISHPLFISNNVLSAYVALFLGYLSFLFIFIKRKPRNTHESKKK